MSDKLREEAVEAVEAGALAIRKLRAENTAAWGDDCATSGELARAAIAAYEAKMAEAGWRMISDDRLYDLIDTVTNDYDIADTRLPCFLGTPARSRLIAVWRAADAQPEPGGAGK